LHDQRLKAINEYHGQGLMLSQKKRLMVCNSEISFKPNNGYFFARYWLRAMFYYVVFCGQLNLISIQKEQTLKDAKC